VPSLKPRVLFIGPPVAVGAVCAPCVETLGRLCGDSVLLPGAAARVGAGLPVMGCAAARKDFS